MAEDGNPRLGQSLIPAINKLQDVFAQLGSDSTIDLPQVAVVGSRSSGKSSVLEALVGRDFLPRGLDICTRRPLVLQLVQNPLPADDSEYAEWGEFLHLPNRRFTDFSAIRSEIQAETEREAGANKGVSDKQIRLKIFSPYVLNINLVDLPGISKVPVGDQPTDIEARIRTMILSYIKHATCIILAVSPANSDLVNSDALQMARLADPDGSRTIGVITKLDIMDRGTDACNFLLGKVIPLRLGYFGVINRGQEDIVANRSIQDALAHEENFFHTHPVYHSLAERCGIPQLAKKLNQILAKHIRVMLPDLRSRINAQMVSVKKELSSCGKIPESKSGQGALLLRILTKFSDAFTSGVDGKNQEMSTSELAGGARINYIFQSIFVKRLEEVDPCDDLTDKDIQTAIQNATGSKHALFVPEVPFQVLVRRQIARLLDPSLQCVRFIYDELIKLAHQCETSDVHRFPLLWRHLEEVVGTFLREGLAPAETMVGHLIAMEMDYINTSHPAFIGGSKAIVSAIQQQKSFATSVSTDKSKEGVDIDRVPAAQKAQKLPTILARTSASGLISNSAIRPVVSQDKTGSAGRSIPGTWGISSLFGVMESYASANGHSANKEYNDPVHSSILGVGESHASANGRSVNKEYNQPVHNVGPISSTIQLKEPPAVLRPIEAQTEQEAIGIAVTRKLLRSYFDIVRKNVQDFVPKAIMHFLVNHAKRELRTVLIENLYKENSFSEMLEEREDIAIKRKQCRKVLQVLQQAIGTLDELSLDFDMPSKQAQQ